MEFPRVTIIVLNYNGLRLLPDCFLSLSRITYPDYEVILADNNSTDGSAEWFNLHYAGERFRLLRLSTNLHFAGGNNSAAKLASGDYLFFINNDVRVKSDFVQSAMRVMLSDKTVAICQSNLVDYSLPDEYEVGGEPRETLYAVGAALLISKDVFNFLGGFDESFKAYVEDIDLSIRTRLMGYKVMFVPSSIVFHLGNATAMGISGYAAVNVTRNFPMMMMKNLQLRNLIVAMPLFAISFTGQVTKNIMDGNTQAAKFKLTGMKEFVQQLSTTLSKRKVVQTERTEDDSAILRFTSLIDMAIKFKI